MTEHLYVAAPDLGIVSLKYRKAFSSYKKDPLVTPLMTSPQLHPSQPAQRVKTVLKLESEAATGGVLWKKTFLKISQISQENTCVGISF